MERDLVHGKVWLHILISANQITSPDPSTFSEEVLTSHEIVSIIEGLKLDKVWGLGAWSVCLRNIVCLEIQLRVSVR